MELFNCRLCNGSLKTVLDLGNIHVSNFVSPKDQPAQREPLALAVCEKCGFAQLKHMVDPDLMYRNYWYKSSLNSSMLLALQNVVGSSIQRWENVSANPHPIALDIGCNDGSMLDMYPENFIRIGFEPALNLTEKALENMDAIIPDYFSADKYPTRWGKADIVTAIAMFYDLNDPASFLQDVVEVMADNGIFVVQMTDMISMLRANAFDNICHEHAGYYTLLQTIRLFEDNGLTVFDVGYNDVNGGSMRVYARKSGTGKEVSETVLKEVGREETYLAKYENPFLAFALRVMAINGTVTNYLQHAKRMGVPVYALGASTKGNTLLQYFNIDRELVKAIGEVNEDKFGKVTVGSNIPIVPEKQILDLAPPIIMILPWHFNAFFIQKLWDLLTNTTTLLFPLPEPELFIAPDGNLHVHPLLTKEEIVPWAW